MNILCELRGFHVTLFDLDDVISSIPNVVSNSEVIDLEALDFFTGRRFVVPLLARQGNRCIYTLKTLTAETAHLDHIVPSFSGGANSYRNIVACTFEANARKGDGDAAAFLRQMFREGLLSEEEFKSQKDLLERIALGELKPEIS